MNDDMASADDPDNPEADGEAEHDWSDDDGEWDADVDDGADDDGEWDADVGDRDEAGDDDGEWSLDDWEVEDDRETGVAAPGLDVALVARALARGLTLTLLLVVLTALTLVLVGAYVPGIPVLGVAGSFASGAAPRMGTVALLAGAVALLLTIRRPTWPRRVALTLAVLCLVGCSVIVARWMLVGADAGVRLAPFAMGLPDSDPDERFTYLEAEGQQLEVAVWNPAGAADAPVAVFVHGGGWIGGSPTDNSGTKRWFADQGWLVLSVQYSLSSRTQHFWDTNTAEVGCALAWTGEHADVLGGDLGRVVLMGDSAGGNLAINAAYQAAAGTSAPACAGALPEVAAVAVLYPAVDPAGVYRDPDLVLGGTGDRMVASYVGGRPEEFPERYVEVASVTHLTEQAPPTLILHGTNDHLVPVASTREFARQAEDVGVDVTLVEVPYAEHIFDREPVGSDLYRKVTMAWLADQGLAPTS